MLFVFLILFDILLSRGKQIQSMSVEYVIDGRKFKWNVPPGHSEELTKSFFFWTSVSKKYDLNLNGEWKKYKKKAESYAKVRY